MNARTTLTLFFGGFLLLSSAQPRALPTALSDQEFWSLVTSFSEPGGTFRSENLVSNELHFVQMIRGLRSWKTGGVYVGVGPEQNFSYIAGVWPELAFIIDVRRENRNLHLMYKALFELSVDRADFVSRLFSRRRPPGPGSESSAQELLAAYERTERDDVLHDETLTLIRDQLVSNHKLPLAPDDLRWIEYVYGAFASKGPGIRFSGCQQPCMAMDPTYATLMTALDATGQARSYLATEASFGFVKELQAKNLIVPIVGNFAGPKAIRAVGNYLRQHDATVSVFYGSNVTNFLSPTELDSFCGNLATIPHHIRSVYIGGPTRQQGFHGFRVFADLLQDCASAKP